MAGDERLTIPVVAIFIVVQLFLSIMVILIRKQKVSTIVLHASALILFSIFYFLATFKNGVVPGMGMISLSEALFYSSSLIILDGLVYFMLSQFNAEDIYVDTILQQVNTDWLTSLNNYGSFVEQLANNFKHWQKTKEPLSMIALDIDHFKNLNDGFGHLTGKRVLAEASTVMEQVISSVPKAKSYRVGGDEINIVLPNCSLEEATCVAEKLKESLNKMTFTSVDGEELIVTISIGVAQTSLADYSPEDLYERADQMLYRSKARGRNNLTVQNNEF